MKVNQEIDLPDNPVQAEGAKDVFMKILAGPADDSDDIIMRLFTVLPGGHTPLHVHDWEHLVRIEKGRGLAIDGEGGRHEVRPGNSLFIPANEEHQFCNPFSEEFQFICVIPNPQGRRGA